MSTDSSKAAVVSSPAVIRVNGRMVKSGSESEFPLQLSEYRAFDQHVLDIQQFRGKFLVPLVQQISPDQRQLDACAGTPGYPHVRFVVGGNIDDEFHKKVKRREKSELLFFYEFAELETGDGAFGIFGTFFLNGFLTFNGDAETSTLAFANIGPVYLVVEEI